MAALINTRYYKWYQENEKDELEEIIIVRVNDNDTYFVQRTKGKEVGEKFSISAEDLSYDYTKLSPDGFITFNIVSVGKSMRDVMVTFNRTKDFEAGDQESYAVCRQGTNDIFAQQYQQEQEYTGISISKDTCPANVEFINFLACDGCEESIAVAYYIGDKIKDILALIKLKNYDIVLQNMFTERCKYKAKDYKPAFNKYMQLNSIDGYSKSVEELLKVNNFSYDIYRGFDIIPFNLDLAMCINNALDPVALETLKLMICKDITKSIVIPYDKSINLSTIERSYQLVSDVEDNVYVIAYIDSGNYIAPNTEMTEDGESTSVASLLNMMGKDTAYLQEAYSNLNFNKSKFNM